MSNGMQTMDQCLQNLVSRGLITKGSAMEKAVDKNQFKSF
jgi:twitching motility protein PilT